MRPILLGARSVPIVRWPAPCAHARTRLQLALLLALSGCAQVVSQGGFPEVKGLLSERGVADGVDWQDQRKANVEADSAVHDLLSRELTVNGAVQVALLKNPSFQASYEELGVAQADLVQAGLLKNPTFTGAMLFGGVSPTYDFDVAQNFLDALLIPARKRITGAQFEQARLRVAGEVFALAQKVRATFYRLQGAEQLVSILEVVLAAEEASREFATDLHAAGNLSDLQLANEQAVFEDVKAGLLRAKAETVEPREELRELLGLANAGLGWTTAASLPGLPDKDPELERALALARDRRLELAAAAKEETVLSETLETARFWRYLGGVEIGADTHREQGEKNWVSGPSLSLDLPIFDQRQAELFRLESQLRQSERRTQALKDQVAAEVRRAYGKLASSRELAEHYRRFLLPARRRVVAQSQEFYNFMLLGGFDLLTAKRTEIEGYSDYVGAVQAYWISRSELERAVGARLPGEGTPSPVMDEITSPQEQTMGAHGGHEVRTPNVPASNNTSPASGHQHHGGH